MRIALIGPVYPFKGGISHYTGMMARALSKKHEVSVISYKMQYPKLLFKKEQRDYSNDSFKVEDAEFWLNTANPLNIMNTAKKIRALKPDLVIVQWWHPYFSPCYRILRSCLKGIPMMYVCHNVFPHERFPMDRALTKSVLKKGDMFIVQSNGDAQDLISIKPGARYIETPHPTYDAFKMQNISRSESREMLGIGEDERIILFFGFVREYKGLKHLIKAMPAIKEKTGARLMVVGDFGDSRQEYRELIDEVGASDVIETVEEYVPDSEVEKYFAACDIVALPYESATQSGIVQIAFGFEKPVIVTNVGGLPEVVEDGKTGFVIEPKNSVAIADAVGRFFASDSTAFSEAVRREAYRFSWDRMTEVIETLYNNSFGDKPDIGMKGEVSIDA